MSAETTPRTPIAGILVLLGLSAIILPILNAPITGLWVALSVILVALIAWLGSFFRGGVGREGFVAAFVFGFAGLITSAVVGEGKEKHTEGAKSQPVPQVAARPEPQAVQQPEVKPKKPLPLNAEAWEVFSKEGISVKLTKYRAGKINLLEFGRSQVPSKDDLLEVRLEITNSDPNKKRTYEQWPGSIFNAPKLEDDKGNRYQQVRFSFGLEVEGQTSGSEPIYSDKPLTEVLVFEKPVPGAKS
ncbi:DUF308 domain-containing protein [Telmatocola sphagniphila]|uniref:DUF308 domain-containing protein n=1 Tax=Telmatocola sphagniphila TaxID=1123043 RepID=A0A8E6EV73_9BACT|nr:DUF308 domain-containing protein [Telmatocola sphagniphila]QVL32350.1 DUF308 domain-containing protein [Telmatocola sphagniphila]